MHPLLLKGYQLKNRLNGFSYEVIHDGRYKTEKPIIYAATHIGKFDVEVVSEAIKEHYVLLSGDFERLQGSVDIPFLGLNGVVFLNENDKKDRQRAVQRMGSVLKEKGNLLYFPEGAWNLKPALPVLPCYWGIIDVAKRGAVICPVAIEQYGKHFVVNIASYFEVEKYMDDAKGKGEAIRDLRDALATLKYEIWEKRGLCKREDVSADEWGNYIECRLSEWPDMSVPHIESMTFHPKGVTAPDEAFSFADRLIPSKQNAFLLKDFYRMKTLRGQRFI